MKKIWLDIANTPQVHFMLGIKSMLNNCEISITARDFSETVQLLEKYGEQYQVIGDHKGKNTIKKIIGIGERFLDLKKRKIEYDFSISCGSEAAIYKAFLERKKIITFGDNDLAKQWTYGILADYCFFPTAIDKKIINKQMIKNKKIIHYDGFKEDIYLANYKPQSSIKDKIPFENYIIVRPENIKANYVKNGNNVITPDLLRLLVKKGYNVLYLPRYDIDANYAKGLKNIFIPKEAINGLDAVYYSDGVLTGAGTFAREAACLGVPAISFFAGHKLLAVDRKLIDERKMCFSRNPSDIVNMLPKLERRVSESDRSKQVYLEVKEKLLHLIK